VADTVVHISVEMTVVNCTITTTVGRLARSEICNSRILNELSDMRSYSMKNNLIITFTKQDKLYTFQHDENSIQVEWYYLGRVMKIPDAD